MRNLDIRHCNYIRYKLYLFSVVNKVGNGKFWVDETDQRSNLLFIQINKAIVGAPAMVTRLEEVRIIYNDSMPLSF